MRRCIGLLQIVCQILDVVPMRLEPLLVHLVVSCADSLVRLLYFFGSIIIVHITINFHFLFFLYEYNKKLLTPKHYTLYKFTQKISTPLIKEPQLTKLEWLHIGCIVVCYLFPLCVQAKYIVTVTSKKCNYHAKKNLSKKHTDN